LHRLLCLLQLPLQPLDAILRLGQRVFLHEGELGHPIARRGIAVEHADQPVRLGIDRRQRLGRGRRHRAECRLSRRLCAAGAGDELGDDVTFFVGHWGTLWVPWGAM
jgi:hypothetical protein